MYEKKRKTKQIKTNNLLLYYHKEVSCIIDVDINFVLASCLIKNNQNSSNGDYFSVVSNPSSLTLSGMGLFNSNLNFIEGVL